MQPPAGTMRWAHLVILMALGGDGPDPTLRGIIAQREMPSQRTRNTEQDQQDPGPQSAPDLSSYRLLKKGPRLRRESLSGRLLSLQHGNEHWVVDPNGTSARHWPAAMLTWPDQLLSERRPLRQYDRDDFTRAANPPSPTVFLGRQAWQVDVAPPPRKPFALTMIIDDETGLVLAAHSGNGTSFVEWRELELGAELPDDLFVWQGPTTR